MAFTRQFAIVNATGKPVNDAHAVFTFTGGSLTNPKFIFTPAPGVIKANVNQLDFYWDAKLAPGAAVVFEVDAATPDFELYEVRWTLDGQEVGLGERSAGEVMIANSTGLTTPLSVERLTGSLVTGGLDRTTAIERAETLGAVIEASGAEIGRAHV